jgi:hypothetical protein
MTQDPTLRAIRHRVRAGDTPPELVDELRAVVRRLARSRRLPPGFAPYGQWNDEAAEEVFASWYADRLVAEGRLLALLDRAPDISALRRLAERSLRQHLLNAHDRSQARNLFARLVTLLASDPETYRVVQEASRPQHRWYALATEAKAEPWSGPERILIAHAWALGDFTIIRYRAGAAKLSPVLDATELQRFVNGLLERTASALTPALIAQTLAARFGLGEIEFVPIDDVMPPATTRGPEAEVLLRDTADMVLLELTPRQVAVLKRSGDKVADIAAAVGCSVGTVVNEQRRIAMLVERVSGDDAERDSLLNLVADLLYVTGDG